MENNAYFFNSERKCTQLIFAVQNIKYCFFRIQVKAFHPKISRGHKHLKKNTHKHKQNFLKTNSKNIFLGLLFLKIRFITKFGGLLLQVITK